MRKNKWADERIDFWTSSPNHLRQLGDKIAKEKKRKILFEPNLQNFYEVLKKMSEENRG